MDHRWSGPANPALPRVNGAVPPRPPHRQVRIPQEVRRDLARIAAATRTVGDGGSASAQRVVGEAEAALLRRATLGPTTLDYARIDTIGYEAWLEEQLNYSTLDDSALEDALHAELPTLSLSSSQLWSRYEDNQFVPVYELWLATVFRALYSPRQLFERMTIFWSNHFSIDIFADYQALLKPIDERDVVRAHALGKFPDMLEASAHSAAMLLYLTNDSNEKNHPNENYARELMELHTMGADRGYTEEDVKEVARCFTGWTWSDPYRALPAEEVGTFRFDKYIHDSQSKKVLGRKIPAGGDTSDGERVLALLARRDETADFIATKMVRWLHGYDPSPKVLKKVAKAYQRSGGDITTMLRTALRAKQIGAVSPKIKRPFHLMISALRALAIDLENPGDFLGYLADAGHLPFDWTPPNGYPDTSQWWSSLLIPRWDFGNATGSGYLGPLDPAIDDPSGGADKIVQRINVLLLNGEMTDATRDALTKFLGGRKSRTRVREAIGLALSSPEFQEY
jgi:hypothetical protein